MRIIAPPKIAATTSATSAEITITGTRPGWAVCSTDGRSGSWVVRRSGGIDNSAVV